MLSLTKVNALLCIALFFNPYALAEPVSSAVNGIQGEGQKDIIVPSKESLKNETTVSSSQNEIATTPLPISPTKELKLTQIIIDTDAPGDYIFGIYPNNNKSNSRIDEDKFLRPNGNITIYDIRNDKLIAEVNLNRENKNLFSGRMMNTPGVLFIIPLKSKSQYLITPNINVESNDKINTTYSFSIHRKVFVK
ncbi:hypothetical protein CWS43_01645 [Rahnella sp. AA]|uniref:hypothetical protein n=1 Tax=Rahnella sp. AA TaxID=2057180 RepID=UPI000C337440|nr:hypothetical protein [Rahnella sp. AA]PKE32632.1 hypothetical protein CWS43_01645 [Rahnella sp. AA]